MISPLPIYVVAVQVGQWNWLRTKPEGKPVLDLARRLREYIPVKLSVPNKKRRANTITRDSLHRINVVMVGRQAVPRSPSPLPTDNLLGLDRSLMHFGSSFRTTADKFDFLYSMQGVNDLAEYGEEMKARLGYVWCQFSECNSGRLVPLISNNNVRDLVLTRCHMYYVFDQLQLCMVNASLVVDPAQAFDLLRFVMKQSEDAGLPGVLAEDPLLLAPHHHHFPVTYTQLVPTHGTANDEKDEQPIIANRVVRTIKVRSRGVFLRGRDVNVEWLDESKYNDLYQWPRNKSRAVPKTVTEIENRQRLPSECRRDTGKSDLEKLHEIELAYVRAEEQEVMRQLGVLRVRRRNLEMGWTED